MSYDGCDDDFVLQVSYTRVALVFAAAENLGMRSFWRAGVASVLNTLKPDFLVLYCLSVLLAQDLGFEYCQQSTQDGPRARLST